MAKNEIPGLKTGGGAMSKVISTAVVLAILVIVVKHPSDAADYVKTVFGWIDQIATFLRELAGSSASVLASAPIRAASAHAAGHLLAPSRTPTTRRT